MGFNIGTNRGSTGRSVGAQTHRRERLKLIVSTYFGWKQKRDCALCEAENSNCTRDAKSMCCSPVIMRPL